MSASRYTVSLRIYVVFSAVMAAAATATGLFLVYLVRPFVSAEHAERAAMTLFPAAAAAGALAAVAGLLMGLRLAGRIRGIVAKADAIAPIATGHRGRVLDELGALDAAMGRLTLSMDRFVRDRDILARLPEGMFLLGPDARLLFFNATAETLLGPLGRFRSAPLFDEDGVFPLLHGNTPLARLVKRLQDDRRSVHSDEVLATTSSGQPLLLEVTLQRRDGPQGFSVISMFFRDASEKRRIRDQIRRADQLAFLGGMAAKVAHEIRTPQATIRGLVELLQSDLAVDDPRSAYIDRILQGLERQDRLVEDLLTLSHPEPESWQAVSVDGLMAEVLDLLPPDPRLTVTHVATVEELAVWGDALRLSQVLTNLIRNALEASPETGAIEVLVERDEPDRGRIIVRNTGVGIPLELQERVFQPFFTTKARGTGLGLAIARQIVEAHRGSLRVESDGETETRFVVELPLASPVLSSV